MAARATEYAESLGTSADSGTTYATKTSVTFTPDASSTYLILWSCLIQDASNLTTSIAVRLQDTTNTITYGEQRTEMKDIADWNPAGGAATFTTGGSPSSTTYAIQWREVTAATTCNIKEARLLIIKLDTTVDAFTYTAATTDTTSGTYTDAETLTFTPGTAGDYLIIASAHQTNVEGGGDELGIQLLDSDASTVRGLVDRRTQKDPADIWGWSTMYKEVSLAASSQSFKIQHRNTDNLGDTSRLSHRCIVALRLDKFSNNYYVNSQTRVTTTSTTYQNGQTITQTPVARNHAILACAVTDTSATTTSVLCQLLKTATSKTEMRKEAQETANRYPWFHFERENLAASSTTWTIQYRQSAAGTAGLDEQTIIILDLELVGSGSKAIRYDRISERTHGALLQM